MSALTTRSQAARRRAEGDRRNYPNDSTDRIKPMSKPLWGLGIIAGLFVFAVILVAGGDPTHASSLAVAAAGVSAAPSREDLIAVVDTLAEATGQFKKAKAELESGHHDISARVTGIEHEITRRPGGGVSGASASIGNQVINSAHFKANAASMVGRRGKLQVTINNAITSVPDSGGSFVAPDYQPGVVLPKRRLTVRDLLAPGKTASNLIQYPRQTVRTNAAAPVSEGGTKPESAYAFDMRDAPVRTIAHWVKVSDQIWTDAPMLQSTLDGELRYGLQLAEEEQLLFGAGTSPDITGIVPEATAYLAPFSTADLTYATRFDILLLAIAQSEAALLPATGIVLNNLDLDRMRLIKDLNGRYIAGGPFGQPITMIWGRPVVGTPAMDEDKFLVGAFRDGAQIFDREEINVEIATENEDDFIHNLLVVRCEERLALAVKRPQAFIWGDFSEAEAVISEGA